MSDFGAAISDASRRRQLAATAIGALWRDVVFVRVGAQELDPLAAADDAYLRHLEALESLMDSALRELDAR